MPFLPGSPNTVVAGMGIKISTIPIMTSECVPAIIRGGLVMSFQLWVAFGIFMYVLRCNWWYEMLKCVQRFLFEPRLLSHRTPRVALSAGCSLRTGHSNSDVYLVVSWYVYYLH